MIGLLLLALTGTNPYVLDPATYVSKSGDWRLEVDPYESRGAGPGWYRCTQGDATLWYGRLPFTLQQAAITDQGVVVGWASTRGEPAGWGELLVVRIDEVGEARVLASELRHSPRSIHGESGPRVTSLALSADQDTCSVSVADTLRPADPVAHKPARHGDRWVFDVETGAVVSGAVLLGSTWVDSRFRAWPCSTPSVLGTSVVARLFALPQLSLEELSPITLSGDATSFAGVRIQRALVLAGGELCLYVPRPARLLCFSRDGRFLFESPVDERVDSSLTHFTAHPDGGVRFEDWQTSLAFDARGTLFESCEHRRQRVFRHTWIMSGSLRGAFYEFDLTSAAREDSAGNLLFRLERGADRRWLEYIDEVAMDSDGWTAVLESPLSERESVRVHAARPDGNAIATFVLELAAPNYGRRIHLAKHRVFICLPTRGLVVIDLETGLTHFENSRMFATRPVDLLDVIPSHDGREVLVFESHSPIVRRFALGD